MSGLARALLCLSLILAAPATAQAAVPGRASPAQPLAPGGGVVGNGTPGSCTQAALHAALAGGGLVTFNCGGPATVTFSTPETISVTVTIDGGSHGAVRLSGNEATRLFEIDPAGHLTLRNLILEDAAASGSDGGAIVNHGTLIVEDSTIQDSRTDDAHSGGAIFTTGPVTLTSSGLRDNTAGSAGGLFANLANARVVIYDTDVWGNQATNTTTGYGGGIWVGEQARLNLGYADIGENQARLGGALYVSPGAVVSITTPAGGVLFRRNQAQVSGGAIYTDVGGLALDGAVFESNKVPTGTIAASAGGALYTSVPLTLRETTFLSNTAPTGGAVFSLAGAMGVLAVEGAVFEANWAEASGGGLFTSSALVLTDTTFIGNTSGNLGGGAYVEGDAALAGGLFQGNQASHVGGGLYTGSHLTLADTAFISNTSLNHGGGAYAIEGAALTGGWFRNNRCAASTCRGGGLYTDNDLMAAGTRFDDNQAGSMGGGAHAFGAAALAGGEFVGNQCSQAGCVGGGLYAGEALAITGTQFISNTASHTGGGVQHAGGYGRVINALFARNQATFGAALALSGDASAALLHSTLVGPAAPGGSAVFLNSAGTLGITNTIVASTTVGVFGNAGSAYEDYNLFFGVPTPLTGSVAGGGHRLAGDPAFVNPASDNYRLRAGSAAIDQGADAGVAFDFEGDPRPQVEGFDIGFDEVAWRQVFLAFVRR